MKKTFWSCCVMSSVMAVAISAQQAPATPAAPATPSAPAAGAQMKSDAKAVSVSGCLQKGTAADTYTFTVMPAAAGAATAAPAAAGAPTGTFTVAAATGVNLTPHVGHRVELTGSVAAAPAAGSAASAGAAAAPAGGATAPTSGSAPTQTFHATALKMVAPSCTP
jgi:hypothetical protein